MKEKTSKEHGLSYDTNMPNRERKLSPAETVAGNYDLLIEILIRLPVRSLLRFKSVSKHWFSLITNPNFTRRLKPNPKHSGLFLQCISAIKCTDIDFVPLLDDENLPFMSITSAIHSWTSGMQIIHSCNGLFLCSSFRGLNNSSLYYYIYNPTTGRFTTLPNPNTGGEFRVYGRFAVDSINLAFDPLKSPHYKVVCIYHSCSFPLHFEIVIYSSETGLWMCSAIRFPMWEIFSGVVFCNGSLHWIPGGHDLLLYFNVEEELLATTPLPPILDGWEDERRISYFGESRGHLHLIEIYSTPTTHFNVYEMERDYSGWFIKYRVDLDQVAEAFPEMIADYLPPSNLHYYRFVILGLIQEYDNKESFLVVYIPGKAIRYNFHDKSFKELCDFPPSHHACTLHISTGSLKFSGWFYAFAYTESLASV